MYLNEKLVKINKTFKSEMEMMRTFVDSHHYVVSASEKIYSSYCPSCTTTMASRPLHLTVLKLLKN